jgi:hypothetical protein
MRNVREPRTCAALASWVVPEDVEVVVDGGVCVGDDPPVPADDGVVPPAGLAVAAPAAGV